jgi:hypothetical protein
VLWVNQLMKEMVSWRGVAKKRRKQERPVRLTKCSLTVAATQQSWPWGNLYLGRSDPARVAGLDGLHFESPSARPVTTSARLSGKLLGGFASHHGAPTDLPTRVAENHLIVRFPLRAMRAPKIHRLTSTVFERDRVIFVRPALFARVFVTR